MESYGGPAVSSWKIEKFRPAVIPTTSDVYLWSPPGHLYRSKESDRILPDHPRQPVRDKQARVFPLMGIIRASKGAFSGR
jgi:hypothetical protein